MTTNSSQREQVREKIARICNKHHYEDGGTIGWESLTAYEREDAFSDADKIISILEAAGYRLQQVDAEKLTVIGHDEHRPRKAD